MTQNGISLPCGALRALKDIVRICRTWECMHTAPVKVHRGTLWEWQGKDGLVWATWVCMRGTIRVEITLKKSAYFSQYYWKRTLLIIQSLYYQLYILLYVYFFPLAWHCCEDRYYGIPSALRVMRTPALDMWSVFFLSHWWQICTLLITLIIKLPYIHAARTVTRTGAHITAHISRAVFGRSGRRCPDALPTWPSTFSALYL